MNMNQMWPRLQMSTSWRMTSACQMSLTTSSLRAVCTNTCQLSKRNDSRCTRTVFRAEISRSIRKFHRQADRFLFTTISSSRSSSRAIHSQSISSSEDSFSLQARLVTRREAAWWRRVSTSTRASSSQPPISQLGPLGQLRWQNLAVRDRLLVVICNQRLRMQHNRQLWTRLHHLEVWWWCNK